MKRGQFSAMKLGLFTRNIHYIGRAVNTDNLVVATGHAMVGRSLGAGAGKLVSEILNGQPTSMDIRPLNPMRYN